MSNTKNHFNVVSLGLALGIMWGASIFILGLMAWLLGWGTNLVTLFSSLYLGYAPTFLGSLIGMILGFVDGFIGGIIIAFLYNIFSARNES